MATSSARQRPRGNITWLPSGSARVSVYGGVDQSSGKEIRLRETVRVRASRRETEREALRVQTRLLNQVDERRSPRTEATVNELLDRWLDVIEVEHKTRVNYIGKIEKHIRPTLGRHSVGKMKAETVEGLYAQLRRCRDHCRGRALFSTAQRASTGATSTRLGALAPRTLMPTRHVVGATGYALLTGVSHSRPEELCQVGPLVAGQAHRVHSGGHRCPGPSATALA